MLYYNHRKGRKTQTNRKGSKTMKEYKVIFSGWDGYDYDDEPYFSGSYEACEAWVDAHSDDLGPDEWYEII